MVSFRGVVIEHSYRMDFEKTLTTVPWQHRLPATATAALHEESESQAHRHIIALTLQGITSPDTANIYLAYRSHEESLPLGLLPGAVVTFHNLSAKSSSRSGNIYFVNRATSSMTVESLNDHLEPISEPSTEPPTTKILEPPTKKMLELPITHIYGLYQRLLSGCLARNVIRLEGIVVCVQHAFIQYQCLSCECTVVDGQCRLTCPGKRATLNVDGR